jgi:two-component system, chemotaxis family, protein-glutamate methylesterase/glutaminase
MSEPRGLGIIAIGASAGGLRAIGKLIGALGNEFRTPVAVVQHRARESDTLASLLQECTTLTVTEVEDKQPLQERTIFIAPPDYHLLVENDSFALSTEGPVGYSRPSIDVFFESVADMCGSRAVGVVLTGANADGSRGLQRIVERGGLAIVQDPATAEVAMMPAHAMAAVPQAQVMDLEKIAHFLADLEKRREPRRKRVS